jgi:hypothetical protein
LARIQIGILRTGANAKKGILERRPVWGDAWSVAHLLPGGLICMTAGTNSRLRRDVVALGYHGETSVIGKQYFVRQAATLLRFAKSTQDPKVAAALVEKAADFKSQVDQVPASDLTPLAPDCEPPPAT